MENKKLLLMKLSEFKVDKDESEEILTQNISDISTNKTKLMSDWIIFNEKSMKWR